MQVPIGATDPGSIARTVHRPETRLRDQDHTKKGGSIPLKDPSASQEGQGEPEERGIAKGRTYLAGQASLVGLGFAPEASSQIVPAGLPGLAEATHSTTPPHKRRKSLIKVVSSSKVTKWLLSATWQPLPTANTSI
jgi:hypothetical protein